MATDQKISAPGSLFGTPGNLFGSDTAINRTAPAATLLALPTKRTPQPEVARPTLLTRLPGASDDLLIKDRPADAEILPPPIELKGPLSGVRAARILHQHELGLWDQDKLPSHYGRSPTPDLTDADIDARFETLQLYSYMPEALAITRDEFGAMMRPTGRAAYLASALPRAGINVTATATPVAGSLAAAATLPDNAPFAEQLTRFCNEPFFTLANV